MSKDEEYVRENWIKPELAEKWGKFYVWLTHRQGGITAEHCRTESSAWAAAAEFTRVRLQEIAEVESEILAVRNWMEECNSEGLRFPVRERILIREQALLANLREGMIVAQMSEAK
jgi:hypothetical protein